MAVTRTESQVLWSSANTVSVSAGGTSTSDAFVVAGGTFRLFIQGKADNAGTPASNDIIDLFLLTEIGDLDATGGDDFTTSANPHRLHLCRLVTESATDGGEDPAVSTLIECPVPTSFKIQAKSAAASNSITVGVRALELISS